MKIQVNTDRDAEGSEALVLLVKPVVGATQKCRAC